MDPMGFQFLDHWQFSDLHSHDTDDSAPVFDLETDTKVTHWPLKPSINTRRFYLHAGGLTGCRLMALKLDFNRDRNRPATTLSARSLDEASSEGMKVQHPTVQLTEKL